jgi:hypothetical protein
MAVVIDHLPFRPYETYLSLPGRSERILVLPRQIILWLSVTTPEVENPGSEHRFPAVLDTGLNESLVINRSHLEEWAGLQERDLPLADDARIRVYNRVVYPRDVGLWLYQNLPFTNSEVSGTPPLPMEVDAGILISPERNKPRLPVLGMRAIETSRLVVTIDGGRQSVAIRQLDLANEAQEPPG